MQEREPAYVLFLPSEIRYISLTGLTDAKTGDPAGVSSSCVFVKLG